MAVDTQKKVLSLRWQIDTQPRQTALCHIETEEGLLPKNRFLFSCSAARAAAALSMSAEDEMLLRQNLSALGYGDIQTFAYSHTARDRIGVAIGSRIDRRLLKVAVVLRGTQGNEWYSNFDVGYTAEHSGFAAAADFAELRVGDYIFTRAIGLEPDLFITGYSRGGAVANILAKRLCDRYGLERVSAYTFASPATTISRRTNSYGCIFNLVRREDFFTRVPPEGWGYSRYGKDIYLSGDVSENYGRLTGETYIGFTRQTAVDNFLRAMMDLAPNVHAYYRRRRQVGEQRMSLYEFMSAVASMLSGEPDDNIADVFLEAMVSEYADLLSFLSSGADLSEIISAAVGVPKCSVADSHSAGAYMAALDTLTDEYRQFIPLRG